jgi:hypothetical protein
MQMIIDTISSTGELKAGVPPGSVLGPLLFLIFINDVADNMTGFGRLFADDTCIGHMALSTSICFVHLQSLLKITPKCLCICTVDSEILLKPNSTLFSG